MKKLLTFFSLYHCPTMLMALNDKRKIAKSMTKNHSTIQ